MVMMEKSVFYHYRMVYKSLLEFSEDLYRGERGEYVYNDDNFTFSYRTRHGYVIEVSPAVTCGNH